MFNCTSKFVIATPTGRRVGMANELWMAEEIASQGFTRQIWMRKLNGEWKLITKPRGEYAAPAEPAAE